MAAIEKIARFLGVGWFMIAIFVISIVGSLSNFAQGATPTKGKTEILTTFFPIYLFAKNITAGIENINVDMLLPSGYGCPHDYAISPDDIKKIHQADIIIMNGLGMEEFLAKAWPSGASNSGFSKSHNAKTVVASDGLTPIRLRYYHEHENSSTSAHEYNPHVFASPKQADHMVKTITDSLVRFLPEFEKQLNSNGEEYRRKLDALSRMFEVSLQGLKNPKIVTVHEVFDYMARDYGFDIIDVIEKEPGEEPSAKELLSEIKEFRDNKIAALFSEPQYSARIVEVIGDELHLPVIKLDPVAQGPSDPPLDYYERIMIQNLNALARAMK